MTITERDEHGKIVKKVLSSEEARAMQVRSKLKGREASQEAILIEMGYEDPNDAPELEKLLADIAAGKSSQAVAATKELTKRRLGAIGPVENGRCPFEKGCMIYKDRVEEKSIVSS